uniref:Transmembrane protein n=1 Tax=Cacopsylla melanoneura TaxID=428564 RepID=A0A8D8RQ15_9HEMI
MRATIVTLAPRITITSRPVHLVIVISLARYRPGVKWCPVIVLAAVTTLVVLVTNALMGIITSPRAPIVIVTSEELRQAFVTSSQELVYARKDTWEVDVTSVKRATTVILIVNCVTAPRWEVVPLHAMPLGNAPVWSALGVKPAVNAVQGSTSIRSANLATVIVMATLEYLVMIMECVNVRRTLEVTSVNAVRKDYTTSLFVKSATVTQPVWSLHSRAVVLYPPVNCVSVKSRSRVESVMNVNPSIGTLGRTMWTDVKTATVIPWELSVVSRTATRSPASASAKRPRRTEDVTHAQTEHSIYRIGICSDVRSVRVISVDLSIICVISSPGSVSVRPVSRGGLVPNPYRPITTPVYTTTSTR